MSWLWSSIVEKTTQIGEVLAKDLNDFVTTVHQDTSSFIRGDQSSSSAAKQEYSSKNANSIFHTASPHIRSQLETASTYTDSFDALPAFIKWRKHFDLSAKESEIATILEEEQTIRTLYKNIVPVLRSHEEFFTAFYFVLGQDRQDISEREALMARAVARAQEEDECGWDNDSGSEAGEAEEAPSISPIEQPLASHSQAPKRESEEEKQTQHHSTSGESTEESISSVRKEPQHTTDSDAEMAAEQECVHSTAEHLVGESEAAAVLDRDGKSSEETGEASSPEGSESGEMSNDENETAASCPESGPVDSAETTLPAASVGEVELEGEEEEDYDDWS